MTPAGTEIPRFFPASRDLRTVAAPVMVATAENAGSCNSGKSSLDAREKQKAPTDSVIFFPSLWVSYRVKGLYGLLASWSPLPLRGEFPFAVANFLLIYRETLYFMLPHCLPRKIKIAKFTLLVSYKLFILISIVH